MNMKFKVSLLFFGTLVLLGGCQHSYRYGYKYENFEAWAVSDQTDESKIKVHSMSSISNKSMLELEVIFENKEIYLRKSLTKNEVLDFIKKNHSHYRLTSVGPHGSIDNMDISLYHNHGYIEFSFSKQRLIKWRIHWWGTKFTSGIMISSLKKKKCYYNTPITVLELKEIFGPPQNSITQRFNSWSEPSHYNLYNKGSFHDE